MHVFIDTNILLNFFHFSNDELDGLNSVFASHEHGSAEVHLTEQVKNEFARNRENKIRDALKNFNEVKFVPQLPTFMKAYSEYLEIRRLSNELKSKRDSILDKASSDIDQRNLAADRLIGEIFASSKIATVDDETFRIASMRMALGNPPGKNSSLGDAVNWVLLLAAVPNGEDLHIISADGDFYSTRNENSPLPFLAEEWRQQKNGTLFVYRTLSSFMGEHFDGVAFAFDKNKEALIDALAESGSFSQTHLVVAKLEEYPYFSAKEVVRMLDAAVGNNQFGGIVTDYDVSDFLNRVAVPQLANIESPEQLAMIKLVVEEQQEREK